MTSAAVNVPVGVTPVTVAGIVNVLAVCVWFVP